MTLKGTQTEGNLKAAFAGESQANRRYLYFANKADIEGFNDVSAVFRSGDRLAIWRNLIEPQNRDCWRDA